jgi:SynChlorMet cassette protein ScmD
MNHTGRPIADPGVVLREEFDDWAILFNSDTAAAVGINPVGVSVWKRLDGRKSITDIIMEIKSGYEGVPDSADEEIATFINRLVEDGYVGYEMKVGNSVSCN